MARFLGYPVIYNFNNNTKMQSNGYSKNGIALEVTFNQNLTFDWLGLPILANSSGIGKQAQAIVHEVDSNTVIATSISSLLYNTSVHEFEFSSPVTLEANKSYRLGFRLVDGTSDTLFIYFNTLTSMTNNGITVTGKPTNMFAYNASTGKFSDSLATSHANQIGDMYFGLKKPATNKTINTAYLGDVKYANLKQAPMMTLNLSTYISERTDLPQLVQQTDTDSPTAYFVSPLEFEINGIKFKDFSWHYDAIQFHENVFGHKSYADYSSTYEGVAHNLYDNVNVSASNNNLNTVQGTSGQNMGDGSHYWAVKKYLGSSTLHTNRRAFFIGEMHSGDSVSRIIVRGNSEELLIYLRSWSYSNGALWHEKLYRIKKDILYISTYRMFTYDTALITLNPLPDTVTNAAISSSQYAVLGSESLDGKEPMYVIPLNTPPTTPTTLTSTNVTAGQTYEGLQTFTWTAGASTDIDGQSLTYQYEFWDGTSWIPIGSGGTTIKHTLPSKVITGAKLRVRAYDGVAYGSYRESGMFNVSASTKTPPNMLDFKGTSDHIKINNRIVPTTGNFTFEFSFKTVASKVMVLLDFASTSATTSANQIQLKLSSSKLVLFVSNNTNSALTFTTTETYNDGLPHHVSVVRNGLIFSLYVDGVLKGTVTQTGTVDLTTRDYLTFGSAFNLFSNFEGSLTLPRFWNDVRTQQELIDNKRVVVSDSEQGLIDYMVFNTLTGRLSGKKNSSYIGDISGSIEWAYDFSPLQSLALPFPNNERKKENLETLRTKVNEFRVANGLSNYVWTDPVIIANVTPLKAVHWNEIQTAINEVYSTVGQTISAPEVQQKVSETIVAKDRRFTPANLGNRMNFIIRALKNQ